MENLKRDIAFLNQDILRIGDNIDRVNSDSYRRQLIEHREQMEEMRKNLIEKLCVLEAKEKLKNSLLKLREAWNEVEDSFYNPYIDCDPYILGSKEDGTEYPFNQSFHDIDVIGWIDGCIDSLEK